MTSLHAVLSLMLASVTFPLVASDSTGAASTSFGSSPSGSSHRPASIMLADAPKGRKKPSPASSDSGKKVDLSHARTIRGTLNQATPIIAGSDLQGITFDLKEKPGVEYFMPTEVALRARLLPDRTKVFIDHWRLKLHYQKVGDRNEVLLAEKLDDVAPAQKASPKAPVKAEPQPAKADPSK